MSYASYVEERAMVSVQVIKQSETANISTEIVRRKATFRDMTQKLLSYSRASEKYSGVRVVDIRIMKIVEDLTFSRFLAAMLRVAYLRYITAAKTTINQQ